MKKTVLITGASSGIGRATAKQFALKGWNVIATMRNPEKEEDLRQLENVFVGELDVQLPDTIEEAIRLGIKEFGKIDAVINNAGYGQVGIFEATLPAQIQKQFDVNVFGVMNVIRAILPHFRDQKDGLILNISSGGGRFTLPLLSLYSSSKFALEGFSEALSYELAPHNIIVKIVEPGGVTTDFHNVANENFAINPELTDYNGFLESANKMFDAMKGARLSTAEEVAECVYAAVTDGSDTLRYVIGDDIKPLIHARNSMADEEYVRFMREKFTPDVQAVKA